MFTQLHSYAIATENDRTKARESQKEMKDSYTVMHTEKQYS